MSTPVLSYYGANDANSNASTGSVMFSILFDQSIVANMFEYNIQAHSTPTNPSNVISGFIMLNTATQAGVSNQYTLPVPALPTGDAYQPYVNYMVRVRVFDSRTGAITNWSNSLKMHYPPPAPTVTGAYYDTLQNANNDDVLYVIFPGDFDTSNQVLITYYYQDKDGNTCWGSSPPTSVTANQDYYYVMIYLNNDVNLETPVYVAAHTTYSWQDSNEVDYYAVSDVSSTVTASAATYAPPVATSLTYAVYDGDNDQTMEISWTPPPTVGITLFVVDHYVVSVYNSPESDPIDTYTVGANVTSQSFSVGDYDNFPCGTTVYVSVKAVSASGVETAASDTLSKNIFYYSAQPAAVNMGYAMFADPSHNMVDVLFAFTPPTDTGCGDPIAFTAVMSSDITDPSATLATANIPWTGSANYIKRFNNVDITPANGNPISIFVKLITKDTNSNDHESGPYNSVGVATGSVPLINNTVYDSGANTLTFDVYSYPLLTECNTVFMVFPDANVPVYLDWFTSDFPSQPTVDSNGVYEYTITVSLASVLNGSVPAYLAIYASNANGIGHTVHNNWD